MEPGKPFPFRGIRVAVATTVLLLVASCEVLSLKTDDCDQYASRFLNVNLDLSKVKQWQASLGLSNEVVSKLETLQGDYTFRARNLCRQRPVYEKAGRTDQYLCMQERLDRSLGQLRVIDFAFKAIGSEKEAKEKSTVIQGGLDYYFKQFMTDTPCSAPPQIKQIAEVMSRLDDIRQLVLDLTERVVQQDRQAAKPTVERVLSQLDYRESPLPSDAQLPAVIRGLTRVQVGFESKSLLLLSDLYFEETTWLLAGKNAWSGFERLPLYKRFSAKTSEPALAAARQRVEAQRALVEFFMNQQEDVFAPLQKAPAAASAAERRAAVTKVIDTLERNAPKFPSGSFLNFVGTLALANGDGERALKYYYDCFLNDRDHLPVYDSLSYSLWWFNGDFRTARKYALQGLALVQQAVDRWKFQREQANANAKVLLTRNGELKRYVEEVQQFYEGADAPVGRYFHTFFERFGLNVAYFNALDITNREQSERLLEELIARNPELQTDVDFLDTRGFVTLRFARSVAEIDEAIHLFRRAKSFQPDADQLELLNRHLEVALKIKDAVRGRDSSLGRASGGDRDV